jgi:GT2 family glycosyltransferase
MVGDGPGPWTQAGGEAPEITVVLDPYLRYRRPETVGISLDASLASLLAQTYPADRTTILLTCDAEEAAAVAPAVAGKPRVIALDTPPALGYYQRKTFGARHARGAYVLLADGDCLYPPTWAEEMVAAFARGGPRVAVVQGVSRFDGGPFARVLDPTYWSCGYEPEGPIRQIYSVHNLALRRDLVDRFAFEDSPIRAGLERLISPKIRRAGYLIWHNRRARVLHDTSRTVRDLWHQALGRGYTRMILWRAHPAPLDRALRPLGRLAIPIYVALLTVRDAVRQLRGLGERGLDSPAIVVRLPGSMLFMAAFNAVSAIGMMRALGQASLGRRTVRGELSRPVPSAPAGHAQPRRRRTRRGVE